MGREVDISCVGNKHFNSLGKDFTATNIYGETLSVNNYYFEKNGKPFFPISGEFHFSRMMPHRWEDELIKIKLAGINIVSTYIFWNHHEEIEGEFDFEGRRDIGAFVRLCKKHGLFVILRVGPFCHGEVRNGGLPDWLYGKPFEVRSTNPLFMEHVDRLYSQIAAQVSGLFFADGGPIIGVQIDNEYMHSSAPWEMTTGISNEWVYGGHEGDEYMLALKALAKARGMNPVFFTCTGWGGASTPDTFLPLWGGYAYRPWLFYDYAGEHPATEEYIYQDFHNNEVQCTNDFKPSYKPEDRPYACCEMGGGMMCSYNYRFVLSEKSVDAMANIKMAGGCNFLGYYMFQGGSNPVGKTGISLNESQVSKISYDYQAALGEFGQIRESYRRLKNIHYFAESFCDKLCKLQTVLPAGASDINPNDLEPLRFSVRTDGRSGFVFINNFQDHRQMPDKKDECIRLKLADKKIIDEVPCTTGRKEAVAVDSGLKDIKSVDTLTEEILEFKFSIAGDENAILPFHFDLDGIDLISATAQPVTRLELRQGNCEKSKGINEDKANHNKYDINEVSHEVTYVFMQPEGMDSSFVFADETINVENLSNKEVQARLIPIEKAGIKVKLLVVSRSLAGQMYVVGDRLIFTEDTLLVDINKRCSDKSENIIIESQSADYYVCNENGSDSDIANMTRFTYKIETSKNNGYLYVYPQGEIIPSGEKQTSEYDFFDKYNYKVVSDDTGVALKDFEVTTKQVGSSRYTISISENLLSCLMKQSSYIQDDKIGSDFENKMSSRLKDAILQIDYHGDIGYAFIDGKMVHDNFYNGKTWEIGLSDIADKLTGHELTIYINPLKKGVKVNVESGMAARMEEVDEYYAGLDRVAIKPVYQIKI